MNNDNRKDYQTVLEEQTPLVCNDAVDNKSSSARLATLLSIGIAVFAFLAMAGQHVSHANSISELKFSHGNSISELKLSHGKSISDISELKAALADHQSQLQTLTVQSTPLLGAALQGSKATGDQCVYDYQCASGHCKEMPYAFCVVLSDGAKGASCNVNYQCANKKCHYGPFR